MSLRQLRARLTAHLAHWNPSGLVPVWDERILLRYGLVPPQPDSWRSPLSPFACVGCEERVEADLLRDQGFVLPEDPRGVLPSEIRLAAYGDDGLALLLIHSASPGQMLDFGSVAFPDAVDVRPLHAGGSWLLAGRTTARAFAWNLDQATARVLAASPGDAHALAPPAELLAAAAHRVRAEGRTPDAQQAALLGALLRLHVQEIQRLALPLLLSKCPAHQLAALPAGQRARLLQLVSREQRLHLLSRLAEAATGARPVPGAPGADARAR